MKVFSFVARGRRRCIYCRDVYFFKGLRPALDEDMNEAGSQRLPYAKNVGGRSLDGVNKGKKSGEVEQLKKVKCQARMMKH